MAESSALKRILFLGKYVGLAFAAFALSLASVLGIRPFGSAFFLAQVFCGVPFLFAAPVFLAAEMFASTTLSTFFSTLVVLVFGILGRIALLKFKRGKESLMAASAALAQLGLVFPIVVGHINLVQGLVWGVFSVGLTFLSRGFVKPVVMNKLRYKLLETELIACGILLAAAALGIRTVSVATFPILPMLALPVILLCGYMGGMSGALVSGLCIGLGSATYNYSVAPIAAYVFMALVGGLFLSAPRMLSASALVLAYVLFTFFFNVGTQSVLMDFFSLLAGAVLYIILPRKALDEFKAYMFSSHSGAAARNMINRTRLSTGSALLQSGRIFSEMSESLLNVKLENKEFSQELKCGVCEKCTMFARCSGIEGFDDALLRVSESAAEKGRASISELPVFLSANCTYLPRLIAFAAEHADKNHAERLKASCEESARGIVAEQLTGMARVLQKLGEDASRPAAFDRAKERLIIEELNYRGVVATEALVTGTSITVIVRTETLSRDTTEKAITKIMRSPFVVTTADSDELAGFTVLTIEKSPHFDVVFSVSGVPKRKDDKSGDTHSFIKIGSDKFMMALCDGMGSGAEAEKASETAIGLIESFYKAGFDHELVLSSVNKFLSLGGGERFNALDICVIDLSSGKTDFIKFGAPATMIKGKDTVRSVEGSALPLGILSDVRPSLQTLDLTGGEMLVMTSDGVSDSFEENELMSAVNNLNTKNPALVTGGLIEHTLSKNSGIPRDDSTVLCARLFERV